MGRFRKFFCTGNWPSDFYRLRFKEVCKRNIRAMDNERWEDVANNRSREWHDLHRQARRRETGVCRRGVLEGKETIRQHRGESFHMHSLQSKCHSREGLYSHNRCWTAINSWGMTLLAQIHVFSTLTDATSKHFLDATKNLYNFSTCIYFCVPNKITWIIKSNFFSF